MEATPWADKSLSEQLPVLRARGEGPTLEFKADFPSNAQRLGQEIAALATSGGGMILLGVSDVGDLVGLSECSTPEGRDNLVRRLEGICKGPVRPAITPSVRFAVDGGEPVMVIVVPQGSQPVYYCNNTPYVRHLTSSRPAEPHEVVDAVRQWLSTQIGEVAGGAEAGISAESELMSSLANLLADLLMVRPEIDERGVNPWLDEIHAQFRYAAEELRELAISDAASSLELVGSLRELAVAADKVSDHEHYLGPQSWQDYVEKVDAASQLAAGIMQNALEGRGLIEQSADQALDALRVSNRRAQDLARRAQELAERGHVEELQHEASQIGAQILRLTHLGLAYVHGLDLDEVRDAGRSMHLIETERLHMDGGTSLHRILEALKTSVARITAALPGVRS